VIRSLGVGSDHLADWLSEAEFAELSKLVKEAGLALEAEDCQVLITRAWGRRARREPRSIGASLLFAFGYPLIVGWWSILLIPLTLAIFGALRRWQERHVFRRLGVDTGHDVRGFLGYLIPYQVLCSSASLRGYAQSLFGAARRWK
jgi:hypothetical protein